MNNWTKLGFPALVAVLLVIATIGVTLAITGSNSVERVAAFSTRPGVAANVVPADGQSAGVTPSCCSTGSQDAASAPSGGCCGSR